MGGLKLILTDLRDLKTALDLNPNDTTEDRKLWLFVEQASALIEEYLDRPGLTFKSRTEYYDGTGTAKLLLRSRPVYVSPTIQVFVDDSGFWGEPSGSFNSATAALTYGTDFALKLDNQENGTSRCGILVKRPSSGGSFGGGTWSKPSYRQAGYLSPYIGEAFGNIKVVYSGGYTVDSLPAPFRLATNMLVARLRIIFPYGMLLSSETYEDRSVSYSIPDREKLMELVKPLIFYYRSWKF